MRQNNHSGHGVSNPSPPAPAKISQFQFLVMTEKNILAYKLFLSLNISYFNLFLCENCNPCYKKVTNLFLRKTALKLRSCQTTPCLKIWLEAQLPPHPPPPSPPAEGKDTHYDSKKIISAREWDSFWEVKI